MNSKSTIIFRADGDSIIGLGHVMRCLAICEILSDNFSLKFAIQDPSDELCTMLYKDVGEIVRLAKTFDYKTDLINFSSIVSKNDIVVLDGYNFDEEYQKKIKLKCKKLIFIDDLVQGHQYADIIINHNGLVKSSDYNSETYTKFFLGPQYVLLRKDFFNKKNQSVDSKINKNIFINLGGADPDNISYKTAKALLSKYSLFNITLILGTANKNASYFEEFNENEKLIIKKGITAKQMVEEIIHCDIAIVSCSTVAYEVATLNKPFIGIVTADNQKLNAKFFEENGIAISVLDKIFSDEELFSCFDINHEKSQNIRMNQRLFFDGKAFERINSIFMNV